MALLGAAAWASAANQSVEVLVLDRHGEPVPNVAVYVKWSGLQAYDSAIGQMATMDQIDGRFSPHILVVSVGTAVAFPNNDVVAHHVYSFSKPNDFVLSLYKGDAPAPMVFDHEGVLTLGCNIHDNMLGYIVVVDTPTFGLTDESGRVTLTAAPDATEISVTIWSPRIRRGDRQLTQSVAPGAETIFRLEKKLRAPHESVRTTISRRY